jgi:hypothetical protein
MRTTAEKTFLDLKGRKRGNLTLKMRKSVEFMTAFGVAGRNRKTNAIKASELLQFLLSMNGFFRVEVDDFSIN